MDPVLCRSPACYSACCAQVDVRVCSLSYPRDIHNHFFVYSVLKTFPSVFLSGVRNSPTVQRVSLTPSQASSKPTSSYVFLTFPCRPLSHLSIPYPPNWNCPTSVVYPSTLSPWRASPFHSSILPFSDGNTRQTQTSYSSNTMSKKTWIFCTK